ncbi:YjbF family lipoprotein [Phaeobacter sp. NW0010-22]|uniref:YjbF family lipoprotein n=1 Tax=Phaeobacter sp. NW0010-22 TaxID=3135907 RepID=UPI0031037436
MWKWALVPVLMLMGCAGGNEVAPLQVEIFRAGQETIAAKRAGKAAKPKPLSRAQIEALDLTIMEVTIENRDVVGYVTLNTEVDDTLPGRVQVWRTTDNISLAMRNGVLIFTRGFGGDLQSSKVEVANARLGPSQGAMVHMIRASDDREVPFSLECDVVDLGVETIEVLEYKYSTRHVQQQCAASSGQVINDYWIDVNGGMIWQSRQWAGPFIGYLRFRRLTK